MPYSLTGASAIGFDLVRVTGGPQVATVLRTALAADDEVIARLAAQHPGPEVRETWLRATGPGRGPLALDLAASTPEESLLIRLERATLGDHRSLESFVRHEALDWTWVRSGATAVQDPTGTAAADVLCDAAVSGFVGDDLDPDVRRAMSVAYLRGRGDDQPPDEATGHPGADRKLAVLSSSIEDDRVAWRHTTDVSHGHLGDWALAMHQATWALTLTDRLRLACDVQLATALAFRRGGFTARDGAHGVWNAVSGVMAACVVSDVLPSDQADLLLAPWRAVHGDDPA